MGTVTINGTDYAVYADEAYADEYLAGDLQRADTWDAADQIEQQRGLVSGTRLLQRLVGWINGAPDPNDPALPDAVKQANALLAADMLANPQLASSGSTASNIKRAYADGTGVDFFTQQYSTPLPSAAWDLLIAAGLVGAGDGEADMAAPVYSGGCQPSYFPPYYDRPWPDGDC